MISLSSVCRSLPIPFLGMNFFKFILFGFHSASRICTVCLLLNRGRFQPSLLWGLIFQPSFLPVDIYSCIICVSSCPPPCPDIYVAIGVGGYFKEFSHILGEIWQVQNWQGRPAGWRPWEGRWFKSKCLPAEFSLHVGRSFFHCEGLQMSEHNSLRRWRAICFTQTLLT